MASISEEPIKVLHIDNLPEDLHTQIKSEAALRKQTLREFVIAALENSISKKPQKEARRA